MKKILLLFVIAASTGLFAQTSTVQTDTVLLGYYIPLDTNIVSCRVSIASGNISFDTMLRGNKLPSNLIYKISTASKETNILYHEISSSKNGKVVKSPNVRYAVGLKNTRPAQRDVYNTIPIKAEDLANITVDSNYISFGVSIVIDGKFQEFKTDGNKITEEVKTVIRSSKPGTKIYFEQIKAKSTVGKELKLPVMSFKIQ